MKTIVRNILTALEHTRENLLAFSDEIWLNIDHNNNEALQAGKKFKTAYNDRMSAFDRLATEVYVESNLSANHIRESIRKLLKAAGIPAAELPIYLREAKDAAREGQ